MWAVDEIAVCSASPFLCLPSFFLLDFCISRRNRNGCNAMLVECSVASEGAEKKRRVGSFDTLITSRRKRKIQTENFSPSSCSYVTIETCRKFPFFGATFVHPLRFFEDIFF